MSEEDSIKWLKGYMAGVESVFEFLKTEYMKCCFNFWENSDRDVESPHQNEDKNGERKDE